jgi:hypothetical protein
MIAGHVAAFGDLDVEAHLRELDFTLRTSWFLKN